MNSATPSNVYPFPATDKHARPGDAQEPRSGEAFFQFEQAAYAEGRAIADQKVARELRAAHADPEFVRAAITRARENSAKPLRHVGQRTVTVLLAGGGKVTLFTPYLVPDSPVHKGRRRGVGRRGKAGSGCYPVLAALGIERRATPLLRSEVARSFVQSASYEEARETLSRAGITADLKTLIGLALQVGEQVSARRDALLEQAMTLPLPETSPLAGKRVVLGVDGGRVRIRTPKRRGRRRKNGRRGFVTEWKEPKGFVLYILDEAGNIDRKSLPWYEVTMGDANQTFAHLVAYLRLLGVHQAELLVIAADGADWIWERVPELLRMCGLAREKVVEVLDFYHACDYLAKALEACRGMSESERRELYKRLTEYLAKGQHAYLLVELRRLAKGKRARKMSNAIQYFTYHRKRMAYPSFRRRHIPLGSGAMESTIRRVVNLRFKGPGIFWTREHIEPLLHLRCVLKSGRWDMTVADMLRSRDSAGQSEPPAIARAA